MKKVCIRCVVTYKICKNLHCFLAKFTQLTKIFTTVGWLYTILSYLLPTKAGNDSLHNCWGKLREDDLAN